MIRRRRSRPTGISPLRRPIRPNRCTTPDGSPRRTATTRRPPRLYSAAAHDRKSTRTDDAAELARRSMRRLEDAETTYLPSARALADVLGRALEAGDVAALERLVSTTHFAVGPAGGHTMFEEPAMLDALFADLIDSRVRVRPKLAGSGGKRYLTTSGWKGDWYRGVVTLLLTQAPKGWQWTAVVLSEPHEAWVERWRPATPQTNQPLPFSLLAPWPSGQSFKAGGLTQYIDQQVAIVAAGSIGGPLARRRPRPQRLWFRTARVLLQPGTHPRRAGRLRHRLHPLRAQRALRQRVRWNAGPGRAGWHRRHGRRRHVVGRLQLVQHRRDRACRSGGAQRHRPVPVPLHASRRALPAPSLGADARHHRPAPGRDGRHRQLGARPPALLDPRPGAVVSERPLRAQRPPHPAQRHQPRRRGFRPVRRVEQRRALPGAELPANGREPRLGGARRQPHHDRHGDEHQRRRRSRCRSRRRHRTRSSAGRRSTP